MDERIGAIGMMSLLLMSCAAQGSPGAANPQNIDTILKNAKSGETIMLAPGNYGELIVRQRQWSIPVTINASAAAFSAIKLNQVSGLSIEGGTVVGDGDDRAKGVVVSESRNIALIGMTISRAVVGVVLHKTDNAVLRGLTLYDMTADGVHIVMSHHVLIDRNVCRDFRPEARVFDNGQLVRDARHPDCIQGWSKPEAAPVSDIQITNNTINGNMQGISFFNHARAGIDDGGFDRITVTGNTVITTRPRGIAILGGRNSLVRDNIVRSIPGSKLERNGITVRSGVSVEGTGNIACGNTVPDKPDSPEAGRCAR